MLGAGDFLQQLQIAIDPDSAGEQRGPIAFKCFLIKAGHHAVVERISPGQTRQRRAPIVRVGFVHFGGNGAEIHELGSSHPQANLHQVGGRTTDELGGSPLAVNANGDRQLLDTDFGMQFLIVARQNIKGLAHAGFQLPMGKPDGDAIWIMIGQRGTCDLPNAQPQGESAQDYKQTDS